MTPICDQSSIEIEGLPALLSAIFSFSCPGTSF
jgi:hypothetical protein